MTPRFETWLRWLYAPLMLVGFNGLAIWLIAGGVSHGLLIPLLLTAIAVSFAVERAIPYQEPWNEPQDDLGRDVAHAAVNETFALVSVLALPAIASVATLWQVWPEGSPFVLQAVFAILVFDFGITIAHWLSHHWGPLWRLHAVHHSVTRCLRLHGLMKHPRHQAVELTFGIAPLLVVGITEPVAWALAFAVAIQLLMQHSNADYRVGRPRYVLFLNEGHRFHHLKWAASATSTSASSRWSTTISCCGRFPLTPTNGSPAKTSGSPRSRTSPAAISPSWSSRSASSVPQEGRHDRRRGPRARPRAAADRPLHV
jgi:sterol desaturase/sphingolipid hydroxylase (fatty acid hydroxylase superfamily)